MRVKETMLLAFVFSDPIFSSLDRAAPAWISFSIDVDTYRPHAYGEDEGFLPRIPSLALFDYYFFES